MENSTKRGKIKRQTPVQTNWERSKKKKNTQHKKQNLKRKAKEKKKNTTHNKRANKKKER